MKTPLTIIVEEATLLWLLLLLPRAQCFTA